MLEASKVKQRWSEQKLCRNLMISKQLCIINWSSEKHKFMSVSTNAAFPSCTVMSKLQASSRDHHDHPLAPCISRLLHLDCEKVKTSFFISFHNTFFFFLTEGMWYLSLFSTVFKFYCNCSSWKQSVSIGTICVLILWDAEFLLETWTGARLQVP